MDVLDLMPAPLTTTQIRHANRLWRDPSYRQRVTESMRQYMLSTEELRYRMIRHVKSDISAEQKRLAKLRLACGTPEERERRRQQQLGKLKTHCKHGHELTPENVYVYPNIDHVKRVCKQCRKRIDRNRYLKERGKL